MSNGIAENDDVAAVDVFVRQQVPAHGAGGRIGQFVDQKVVADQQRILHRAGGNHEGLYQSGGAEKEKDDGDGPFGNKAPRLGSSGDGGRI